MSKRGYLVIGGAILLVLVVAAGILHATFVEDLTGDPRPCPLHGSSHKSRYVRIRYGLLKQRRLSPEYLSASRTLFPRAAPEYQSGGCTRQMQRWAIVLYCSDCETARKKWLRERASRASQPPDGSDAATPMDVDEVAGLLAAIFQGGQRA